MKSERALGSGLLLATGVVFIYYTLWVIVLPFVDEDQVVIQNLFPDRSYALGIPLLVGVIGLALIGCFVAVVQLGQKEKRS
ncbi:uncharacterized protein LOC127836958 [Dreissena polymorpha]|uniref:Dolichol phosphate-mannose biosynthesis regulatory protein n=1 Tax=Dreissena polymorpha TaxID=45954 RepID=A0A9D4F9N9_DREPO|nr:uncharacterized protein LOC127836958 [Dreissena polymorpha]KAH3794723.1 hypothetical protein DPMN_148261 [Dreissena polymorpha]